MALEAEPLLAVLLRAGAVLAAARAAPRPQRHMVRRALLAAAAVLMAAGAGICGLVAVWRAVDLHYGGVWAPVAVAGVLALASAASAVFAFAGQAPAPVVPPAPAPLETLLDGLPPCVRELAADPHLRLLVLSFLSGALAAKKPDKP